MKIIGALLIIWGIADIALSWVGTDLYWEIGIRSHLELQPIIEAQLLAKLTSSNDDGDGYSQADALEAARLELPQIIVY